MLHVGGRRRFRNSFVTFLTTFGVFSIISFLIRSDPIISIITTREYNISRLFCVLILNDPTHAQFIYLSNITWAKHCHTIGLVKYRKLQRSDDDPNLPQSPYHVNIWLHILAAIRQSISSYESISTNDSLIIVPAATFVFREKLSSLFNISINNHQSPLIIIHNQQETNSYILNGRALNLVRNTELIDSCLQRSYPSARETHLWTCVKYSLRREYSDILCENNNCFIHYHSNQLTLTHIKNGFCLKDNRQMCQSIAILYLTTVQDLITLEFFKYRLKPKSSKYLL